MIKFVRSDLGFGYSVTLHVFNRNKISSTFDTETKHQISSISEIKYGNLQTRLLHRQMNNDATKCLVHAGYLCM